MFTCSYIYCNQFIVSLMTGKYAWCSCQVVPFVLFVFETVTYYVIPTLEEDVFFVFMITGADHICTSVFDGIFLGS